MTKTKSRSGVFTAPVSVSINLSTRWQTSKKDGKFVQNGLVGVYRYGRERFGRKQAKCLKCTHFRH